MFEWKHPNYYKELKKIREQTEKEIVPQEQDQEEQKEEKTEDKKEN
jgi:hypothetical protein|tara:strand:- start:270 stop:407 length:138 start_codon:yes stop_codon:yes gene_type:complete